MQCSKTPQRSHDQRWAAEYGQQQKSCGGGCDGGGKGNGLDEGKGERRLPSWSSLTLSSCLSEAAADEPIGRLMRYARGSPEAKPLLY